MENTRTDYNIEFENAGGTTPTEDGKYSNLQVRKSGPYTSEEVASVVHDELSSLLRAILERKRLAENDMDGTVYECVTVEDVLAVARDRGIGLSTDFSEKN